jgi:hypothetical protein
MTKPSANAELAQQVLNFRRAGLNFDVISERLNLTATAAKAMFDQALAAHDPAFGRALESDRLDRLHAAVWPEALKGNLDAVDRVVRISERRERVARVPKVNEHALRNQFEESVKTAFELRPDVDAALIEAGRTIADRVDEAIATGEGQEVTKALYLLPHLLNVLREMLATPQSRANASAAAAKNAPPAPPVDGKLAKLRAIQGSKNTG